MYNRILTIIAAVAITFAGCNKIEETRNDGSMPPFKGPALSIRSFADFNQLNAEIDLINGLTYDELIDYEATLHFSSFGKLADQAMMPILEQVEQAMEEDEDSSITSTELEQMVSAGSQYIHLVSDESGEVSCETKYFQSPFRYIINFDRMFKVDTFYFKVFEGGYVSCGATYFNQLLSMSESTFSTLQSDSIYTVFKYDDGRGNYGSYKKQTATSGKNRVHVEIYYYTLNFQDRPPNKYFAQVHLCARIKGQHKWCGIWWMRQSTHTNELTVKIKIGNDIKTGYNAGSSGGIERNVILEAWVGEWTGSYPYIYSAYGYGKIPPVTCNINWQE